MARIFKGLKKYVLESNDPFFISTYYGAKKDGTGVNRGSAITEPLDTITAGGYRHALVQPFLTEHANGSSQRVFDIQEPLRTQMASVKGGHFALVAPYISRQFGQSIGHDMREPNGTITAGGGKSSLVSCNLVKHYGGGYNGSGNDIRAPLPTVTTRDHNSICTSHLIKMRNKNYGSPMNEPVHTITAGGNHIGEVRAYLVKYYGTATGADISKPLHTVTTKDRLGLVQVEGEDYMIADIGMRMLQPRELFIASGFPEDYIIDVGANGKKATKAEQVARCGNAVPPQFSEALVRANLPELCVKNHEKMA
jgi:DNA (cytosine-5)-methyltransferase 1